MPERRKNGNKPRLVPRKTGFTVILSGSESKVENIFQTYLQIFDSDSDPDTEALLLAAVHRNGFADTKYQLYITRKL